MFSSSGTQRPQATPADTYSRQTPTSEIGVETRPDISRFTLSVADAVLLFHEQGLFLTERTIQRYCHSAKLRALRVDPDTRQPTDRDNYVFLIDPTSIPERISQVREREEFISPTIVATGREETRSDATGRGMSEDDTSSTKPQDRGDHNELEQENEGLRSKVHSLEIDKAVRDEMVKQLKQDREQLLKQLDGHVQTMVEQGRTIGKLETRLALASPDRASPAEIAEHDVAATPADGYANEPVENDEANRYRI